MQFYLDEFIYVEEYSCQLLRRKEACHQHWTVELFDDDPQIPTVLDFRLHDLHDDLLALGPPLGTLLADDRAKPVGAVSGKNRETESNFVLNINLFRSFS